MPTDTVRHMQAVVVIGDLVRSSAITQRREFQKRFQQVVEQLNCRDDGLASRYTVTLGDEFQAVYRDATRIVEHLFLLTADILPQRLRVCIAVGPITTDLNPEQAIGMDGPVFRAARDGIAFLRQSGEGLCVRGADHDVRLEDSTLRLVARLNHGWRPTRWQVLRGLIDDKPVGELASELRITPAAVYKNINEGGLNLLLEAGRKVGRSLTTKIGDAG